MICGVVWDWTKFPWHAVENFCQVIFHSCLPKLLSSSKLVILCKKKKNRRLKNVQGYLSEESISDCDIALVF